MTFEFMIILGSVLFIVITFIIIVFDWYINPFLLPLLTGLASSIVSILLVNIFL